MPSVPHYDLAILGTGSGNSVPTDEMDDWSIAIVEPGPFGGTCLNRGCIPSKMFVHAADVAHTVHTAGTYNVSATVQDVDWPSLRDRVFGRIDPIAEGGEAYRRGLPNVTVMDRPARFTGPRRLRSGDVEFTADRIVLAAGTRPRIPDIDGIHDVPFFTSDDVMRIDAVPGRLGIIGGGAVAAEMGHVFAALGSQVTMVVRGDRLLSHEEPEIGLALTDRFTERGIDVRTSGAVKRVHRDDEAVVLGLADGDQVPVDLLLVAAGRVSNGDRMDLAAGGVEVDDTQRPVVDEYLRTSAEGVWALGDLAAHHDDLKHIANAHARAISHNLRHPGDLRTPVVPNQPRATFTQPEVAAVGMGEVEARLAGHDIRVASRAFGDTAYGWALEDTTSFAKVVVDADTRLLLGAHIIGPMASILLQPLVQAMTFGQTVDDVATRMVWPHPALTEVVEQVLLEVPA